MTIEMDYQVPDDETDASSYVGQQWDKDPSAVIANSTYHSLVDVQEGTQHG